MTGTPSINSDLAFYLKRLRLPRLGEQWDSVCRQASEEEWPYERFLTTLLEAQVFARDQATLERHIRAARFPSRSKTLENFDFSFQTGVRKQVLLHLASLRFVELGHNVVFLGPPGTGKTHLSLALGLKACQAGYSVLFLSAVEMVARLLEAQRQETLGQTLRELLKPDLLIVDEVGYTPIDREECNLFYQFVAMRYEKSSTIITSNKAFDEWSELFHDPVIVTAILDRLLHHSVVVNIKGNSYRLRNKLAPEELGSA